MNLKSLLILLLIYSSMGISAQRIINLNNENADINLRRTMAVIPQEFATEAKIARSFAINPVLQNTENVSIGDIVGLQLFEESNHIATINNIITDVNGNVTLTLKLPNYPMAFAIITTSTEGKSLVNVSIPELGQSFGSRHGTSGSVYMLKIDESKLPIFTCGTCASGTCASHPLIPQEIEIEADDDGNIQTRSQSTTPLSTNCGPDAFANPNAPATIDILVVFTPAVRTSFQVASAGGINAYIANMVANANVAFANSHTGITLQLAHSEEVDYIEPVPHNMETTLRRLQNPTDGFMDEVHTLRRKYDADLVALITVENDWGGMAYTLHNTAGSPNLGFSVTSVASGAGTSQTFAHEIGHNMGLGHAAQQTSGRADGIFSYSYGWRFQGNVNNPWGNRFYSTVMAYQGGQFYTGAANGQGLISERIPFFSNPSITHLDATIGNATQADASRSLRELKHVVAFYSDRIANLPDAPTNIVVTNPTNNGATFTWEPVPNAVSYRLVGPGGSFFPTSNTSFTINWAGWYSPCSTYNITIQALNECGDIGSGTVVAFRTNCTTITPPTITTQAATDITCNSATLNKLATAGTETIAEQGFEYRVSGEISWQRLINNSDLTGLMADATYQFRAYVRTVNNITFYGSTLTFITSTTATQTQTIDFPEIGTKTYGDADITLLERTSADLIISYQSSNEAVATISGNILTIVGLGNAEITASQSGDCNYMPATEVTRTLTVIEKTTTVICQTPVNQLHIFPNPTQNELFIQSELQINRVEVYSTTGALMIDENNFAEKISVSALPRGIYLLKVHTDKGLIVSKFIKD